MNYDYAFYNKADGMYAHTVNIPEEDVGIQDSSFWVVPIDLSTFSECSMYLNGKIKNLPAKPYHYMVWNQTAEAWEDPRSPEQKADDLVELQRQQLWLINKQFEVASLALTETYPETEKITWSIQQNEAFAWYADNSVQTPFLSMVADARGIDLNMLLQKTYEKVVQFQQYSAALIGKRQRYEDAIYAASTEEAIKLINWE